MKRILSFLMFLCVCTVMNAQVKAGDVISGNVHDDIEGLMMVNVVEKDANNRIVAHGQTDMNGNFSFRINNPKNKLTISYVGYQTVVIPIDRKVYDIKMEEQGKIQEVVIKATRRSQTTGLAIPVTEISTAQQTISMKEFEGLALTSVDEALQGRISGLDIVSNSGNLGAGTTMRLRGVSTLSKNANPLIVVNGNILETNEEITDDYNDEKFAALLQVNPEDIEEISVLKDASATAIWGARGANGVIEIKTKRGARGKTRVQYSYRLTGTWQPDGYKLLNGDDYTMFMKESFFNPTLSSVYTTKGNTNYIPEINYDQDFSEYRHFNDNTDWYKEVKQFGQQHQHYVTLSGGGEKANFRVSAGYESYSGSVLAQTWDRFTTRVALDYFVSNRITVRSNIDFVYTFNHGTVGEDLTSMALRKMPNLSVYEEDENGHDTNRYYNMNSTIDRPVAAQSVWLAGQYGIPNPLSKAYEGFSDGKSLRLAPEFIINYDLLGTSDDETRLTYEGQVIFDVLGTETHSFSPGYLTTAQWYTSGYNAASDYSGKTHRMSTRHSLTLRPHFKNEDHKLMMMATYQYNNSSDNSQSEAVYGIPTSTAITSSMGGKYVNSMGSGAGRSRSISYYGQVHYSYKGKYSLTATMRRDGSSNNGKNRRWGTFQGVSARWNLTDEKFMSKLPWISMLSIRPGWGVSGNPPGSGAFYSFYGNSGGWDQYMGSGATWPKNIRLTDLRPERKETWNLGFDFGFLDDKITADLAIYTSTTSDLFNSGAYSIPSSSGFGSLPSKNVGKMRNVGWEFNVFGNQIVKAGKFSMDVNVTFANNRNEILEMDPTVLKSYNEDFKYANGQYLTRVQVHNPVGSIYGFRYKGVYMYSTIKDALADGYTAEQCEQIANIAPVVRNANGEIVYAKDGIEGKAMYFDYDGVRYHFVGGDAIYEDINHDGNINELDIVYLGSSLPKLTGGFGLKFTYDRWKLNMQFNYRVGCKLVNSARMNLEAMDNVYNQSRSVNWRWRNEGDNFDNILPRAATTVFGFATYNSLASDRFVEDASFLRLNYMQLSYSLNPKILKDWGLSMLSFYLTLNNVFCLTKYSGTDPERPQYGYGYAEDTSRTARAKSFTLGTTISF